jgi:chitodextrinase
MSELMDNLPVVEGGIKRPEYDRDDNNNNDGNNGNNNKNNNNNDQQDVGDIPGWKSSKVYVAGDKVVYNGKVYQASWWTRGDNPEEQGEFGPWKYIGQAPGNNA